MESITPFLADASARRWRGTHRRSADALPQRSKRGHPWQASYAVLAVLTSLLILERGG